MALIKNINVVVAPEEVQGDLALAGTVSRNSAERFLDLSNVKDFGAVGDGVADDTAAIQAAAAAGRAVYLPKGNYKISASITLGSFQSLYGDGYGSQLSPSEGMTVPAISIRGSGYPEGAAAYVKVTDLVISNDFAKTMNGIEIVNAQYITVERVFVNSCLNGVYLDSVELVDFSHCYFSSNAELGIWAVSSRSGLVNSWINVTDCLVNGNGTGGTRFVDSASTVLTNVKVVNNQNYGVYMQLTIPDQRMWISINNCDIDSNWNQGVYLEGVSGGVLDGTIHGSWISGGRTSSQSSANVAGHGLFCNLVSDLNVVSTRFFANGNNAMHFVNSTGVSVSACAVQANNGAGVYAEGSDSARIKVAGCSFVPTGSAFTQSEAVQLATGNYHAVLGNTIVSHSSTNINAAGAQSVKFGNTGFTEDAEFNSTGSINFKQNNVEVMSVNSGALRPGSDGSSACGTSGNRWSVVYSANGTIQTSDERLKDFEDVVADEVAAAAEIRSTIRKFKWKDTSSDTSTHFGISAQEVQGILQKHGCTADYSFIKYDAEADAWGVNYPELSMFLMASV